MQTQPSPITLPPIQKIILVLLLLWIGRNTIVIDYNNLTNNYLKSIGRSDLIVKTEKDKQFQAASLKDQLEWLRMDTDALLKAAKIKSVVPAASSISK